ncbi:MAG: CHASE3 domain-containing protein [Xanthobacteraceae bacterium]
MTYIDNYSRRSAVQIGLMTVGMLILLGIGASSMYLLFQLREDVADVAHTLEVENQISIVLLQIRRAESSERGYLLTSRSGFLTDYKAAESATRPAIQRLRELTNDNPTQTRLLDEMLPLTDRRLAEFNTVIEHTINGRQDEARQIVAENAERQTTADIRDILMEMRKEEERLHKLRSAEAEKTQMLSAIATSAGSGALLLLGLASILLVRRSERIRDAAELQLRNINTNLEAAVDERTADLREANEEIQRFAYIVSHDLRSPLVNIMGFTSELEELRGDIFARLAKHERDANPALQHSATGETSDPPLEGEDKRLYGEFNEAIDFIKSSIGKMDRLIAAILTLTREGRREFKLEPIDVRDLIENITKTVAHQAGEADATIAIEPLPQIVSDRLALEQIFSNLIDNALKYLRPNVPGLIQVKGRQKSGYIIYDVTDNGRGIDQKDHQRIFDLFRRAGTQDKPGQGIGLAHVRALVRRMGGTLSVSSEPDKGSTFTIMLPSKDTTVSRGTRS